MIFAMEDWFASGRAVDLVLMLVLLEALLLTAMHYVGSRGPALRNVLPNLVSGGALLVTVRLAIADAGWVWLGSMLLLALLAHLVDLGLRWDRP